jgi:hypothetical protein
MLEGILEIHKGILGASNWRVTLPLQNDVQLSGSETMTCEQHPQPESLTSRRRKELTLSGAWDTDSPKSSLLDSFTTTNTSTACTPETPLVATVRRCLKYSPETPGAECSRSGYLIPANRGSIQIECSAINDHVHVKSKSASDPLKPLSITLSITLSIKLSITLSIMLSITAGTDQQLVPLNRRRFLYATSEIILFTGGDEALGNMQYPHRDWNKLFTLSLLLFFAFGHFYVRALRDLRTRLRIFTQFSEMQNHWTTCKLT